MSITACLEKKRRKASRGLSLKTCNSAFFPLCSLFLVQKSERDFDSCCKIAKRVCCLFAERGGIKLILTLKGMSRSTGWKLQGKLYVLFFP